MIFELLVRNIIVRFLGLYSRYFFLKLTKKEKTSIDELQGGEDKDKQYKQEFYNTIVGCVIFALLSISIAYLVFR